MDNKLNNVTMRKTLLLIILLVSAMTAKAQKEKYDLNGDGKVNAADVTVLVNYILTPSYKSCPDNKHPHWIDLGLPSGTLWRCCNEGASKPEVYGGYYEFGEVASAPSLDQINELHSKTTSVWTKLNGVNGIKITGSNGGTIFLPAAGMRVGGDFSGIGSGGIYWSSTRVDGDNAQEMAFYTSNFFTYITITWYEFSVRPVH